VETTPDAIKTWPLPGNKADPLIITPKNSKYL